jgi:hypothetical protein
MEYDNTNRGVLFKNNKDGNDRKPDYKGSLNVGGVEYSIVAWLQQKKNGTGKFMSLKVEKREQQMQPQERKPAPAPAKPVQPKDEDMDEIPF